MDNMNRTYKAMVAIHENKNKLSQLQFERDKYDRLMGEVLNWTLHMKKEGEVVPMPLTDTQKQKDLFLFKYYESKFNLCEKLIEKEINR